MRSCWIVGLGAFVLIAGVCGGLVWWEENPGPRFRHAFDIGGGRVLTVWSTRQGGVFNLDPDPLMVHYRVDAGGREVVPTTFLEHDDGGGYEFRAVRAEGGRLACVYETTRAAGNPYYFLVFDAEAGESWPRDWSNRGGTYQDAVGRWRDRVGRLRAEHPALPDPFDG